MARQQSSDIDELFEIRNYFYIGNYQQCIDEAKQLKTTSEDLQIERDIFLYRSYIAQHKYSIAINEIKESSPNELKPLKMLAQYFSEKDKREGILEELEENKNNAGAKGHSYRLVAAMIFSLEDNLEDGLRVLHKSDDIECSALRVQIYLKMNRNDLAQKEVKVMQDKDDDATLTQLALAYVNLAIGGDKYEEAFYIFQELIDKYNSTPMLLNGKANALALQHKFEEAEATLQESLEKDSNNPDTLINMMVVSAHLGKPQEVAERYMAQLKDSHADHPFVKEYIAKEEEFDQLAAEYAKLIKTSN